MTNRYSIEIVFTTTLREAQAASDKIADAFPSQGSDKHDFEVEFTSNLDEVVCSDDDMVGTYSVWVDCAEGDIDEVEDYILALFPDDFPIGTRQVFDEGDEKSVFVHFTGTPEQEAQIKAKYPDAEILGGEDDRYFLLLDVADWEEEEAEEETKAAIAFCEGIGCAGVFAVED